MLGRCAKPSDSVTLCKGHPFRSYNSIRVTKLHMHPIGCPATIPEGGLRGCQTSVSYKVCSKVTVWVCFQICHQSRFIEVARAAISWLVGWLLPRSEASYEGTIHAGWFP